MFYCQLLGCQLLVHHIFLLSITGVFDNHTLEKYNKRQKCFLNLNYVKCERRNPNVKGKKKKNDVCQFKSAL